MLHRGSRRLMNGFIYILKFNKSGKYYIGSTNNLERRLIEHKNGESKYTRENGDFNLIFSQKFNSVVEARKSEQKLKSFKSKKVIERIIKDGVIKTHA